MCTDGKYLTVLDSSHLHDPLTIHNTWGLLPPLVKEKPIYTILDIWAPETLTQENPTIVTNTNTLAKWITDGDIPTPPLHPNLWTKDLPSQEPANGKFEPMHNLKAFPLSAQPPNPSTTGGYMVIPRYLKLSANNKTPIGLAVDPTKVPLPALKQLLQDAFAGNDTIF